MHILDSVINSRGKLWWPFHIRFSGRGGDFDFTESFPGCTKTEAIRELINNYDLSCLAGFDVLSYSPLEGEEGF